MNKTILLVFAFIFAATLVLAQGVHELGTGLIDSELNESGQGTGQRLGANVGTESQNKGAEDQLKVGVKLQSGNYLNEKGEQMQIEAGEEKGTTLRVRDVEAHSFMEMIEEKVQNQTRLKVKLSNGMNSEVKVMPDSASARALEVLGAKCGERNCSIELKEVGTGNQTRAAYEVQAEKEVRVLGLFKAKMQVRAQIDAENGEVIQQKKAWWAFLAAESEPVSEE
ncbi:MAG: hypothetical protein KKE23_01460 [Nanoarchaeota archaeon]|nr:hypothetical protein [Nanoarchaeota archaeon]